MDERGGWESWDEFAQERAPWLDVRAVPGRDGRGWDIALVIDGTYSDDVDGEEMREHFASRLDRLVEALPGERDRNWRVDWGRRGR